MAIASISKQRQLAGILLIALYLAGCESSDTGIGISNVELPPDNIIHLEQGWSADLAVETHHKSFGSRVLPLSWMLNIKTPGGEAFLGDRNIDSMGFLSGEKSALNPLGLPVGFTVSNGTYDQKWMGLGCAACHTGEVHLGEKKIRLEGGQSLANMTLFEQTIIGSLSATLADSKRFASFTSDLKIDDEGSQKLRTQMTERLDYLKNRAATNATDVDYGFGRLDAFGQIFNTIGVEVLDNPDNRISPDAPVSFPVLWDAAHLDLVQWNGSAPNFDPGPLLQNVTTAIAVYGQVKVVDSSERLGYKSSIDIKNLRKIQDMVYKLKSPLWPEEILGQLNQVKLARGEAIYQKQCLQCHSLVDRNDDNRKLKAVLIPVKEVGTDPKMVENFLNAKVASGVLENKKLLWLAGEKIAKQEKSIKLVAHVAVGAALNHPLQTIDSILKDYHPVYKASIDLNPDYYKARPLTGIWSAAPYLHNGSVMTLAELLSPVEERRKTFYVGDRQLDIERVGLLSTKGNGRSFFDTSLVGNSNSGHLYGTDLSKDDKSVLLEYLKSL